MKSNIGQRFWTALPYIIATLAIYAALPLLSIAMQSRVFYTATPILDCCAALAVGYFFGKKAKRDPLMPLMSALLFLPCMFIFYNASAWIYMPIAALMSFVGECFGALYYGRFGK